ncbi:MAG: cytochrome c biogenesis protein CcsA [Gemmatimonadota bacterium]
MNRDSQSARGSIRKGRAIMLAGLVGLAGIYLMAWQFTPTERFQGLAQKIFYIHPPAAYASEMAYVLAGIASVLYLLLKDERFDTFAAASAEVGLAFGAVLLTTGPIWAKPIWGAWWTWDARLTFSLILFLLFAGYFALRSAVREPAERARYAAVVAVMGMLLVPFIHLTVYLFNTTHPQPVVVQTGKPALPPEMLRTFLASFAVFTTLYVGMVMMRYGIGARQIAEEVADAE